MSLETIVEVQEAPEGTRLRVLSLPPSPSCHEHAAPAMVPVRLPLLLLSLSLTALAVKFEIPASHSAPQKCLWNYALSDTLVVISVSAPIVGPLQRLDMEVIDGSGSRNVYQSKKGIKGETRMAITTHADADLGVCFRNVLDPCESSFLPWLWTAGDGELARSLLDLDARPLLQQLANPNLPLAVPESQAHLHVRSIDLDVDIGADAVDYNAIAKQESLSGLEVEMRKLEGVVKEIVDELNYLKRREVKMRDTNGESSWVCAGSEVGWACTVRGGRMREGGDGQLELAGVGTSTGRSEDACRLLPLLAASSFPPSAAMLSHECDGSLVHLFKYQGRSASARASISPSLDRKSVV